MGRRLAEGIDLDRYERLAGRELSPERLMILQGEGLARLDRQFPPARHACRNGGAQRRWWRVGAIAWKRENTR